MLRFSPERASLSSIATASFKARNASTSSPANTLGVSRPQQPTSASDRHPAEMASPEGPSSRRAMLPPASGRSVPDDSKAGIGSWEGTLVGPRTASPRTPTPIFSTQASGSYTSPISVSSSSPSPCAPPRPLTRPRAIPYFASPLPRTAYTPPKPVGSPSSRPLHPFFTIDHRVPKASAPRFVAQYSSTETESEVSFSASQSTFDGSQCSGQSRAKDAEVIDLLSQDVQRMGISGAVVQARMPSGLKGRGAVHVIMGLPREPLGEAKSATLITAPSSSRGFSTNGSGGGSACLPPRDERPVNRLPRDVDPNLPIFHFLSSPRPLSICYTRCIDEADQFLGCMKGNIMGFDLEWPMQVKTWDQESQRYQFPQGKTAMIQVGDQQRILLLHLKPGSRLPPGLIYLIRNPNIYKLGVSIANDGRKLMRDFPEYFGAPGDEPAGLLELSYMARAIDGERTGPGTGAKIIALATLCREYLRKELPKDPGVRRSDWSAELSKKQKDYAANDVFSAIQLYNRLAGLAQERGIPLDPDSYCTNIGRQSTSPGARTGTTKLPRVPTTSVGSSASSCGSIPTGKKMPTPAKMAALDAWMEGNTFDEIGQMRNIKSSTAEGYVYQSLIDLGVERITVEHRKRLCKEASVVMSKYAQYRELFTALKAELGEHVGGQERSAGASTGDGTGEGGVQSENL